MFRVVSPCSLSLMTYALLLGKSELSSIAVDQLHNASTNEEGDFGWQRIPLSKDAPDWLYEEGSGKHRKEPIMSEYMYTKLEQQIHVVNKSVGICVVMSKSSRSHIMNLLILKTP